jgi:hypothetical protein
MKLKRDIVHSVARKFKEDFRSADSAVQSYEEE